jgi:hypothetical protein
MQAGNTVISAISDGTFIARPGYFGDDATADAHNDLFDRHGQAWLPIGCFLIRSGARCVLVDAGMGPTQSGDGDGDQSRLVGGQLPVGLRALGIERGDITDVVCTHLHPDHVGWLFDLESRPSFRTRPSGSVRGTGSTSSNGTTRSSRTTSTKGFGHTPMTHACGRLIETPRLPPASRQSRRRATRLDISVSWSHRTVSEHSSSVTRSPVRCSWTSRPGIPSVTSTRVSPTAHASGFGVSSKAKMSPAQAPTFRNSSSVVCSTAAGSVGGLEIEADVRGHERQPGTAHSSPNRSVYTRAQS